MGTRLLCFLTALFILFLITTGQAAAQGYAGYPYTIMTPEHGGTGGAGGAVQHRAEATKRMRHGRRTARVPATPASPQAARPRTMIARGSSGSVLPTPLPRTPLIPPEGSGTAPLHVTPPEQPSTVVPGIANPVPNLPHGPETFQDRASRCAFQQGLYNVPGNMRTQYMGACLQ